MFDLKKLVESAVGKQVAPARTFASTPPQQAGPAPAQMPKPDLFRDIGAFASGVNDATFGAFNKNVFQPYVVQPIVDTSESFGKGLGYAFGGGQQATLDASNQAYNDLKTMHDQLKAGKINQQQFSNVAQQSAATQSSLIPTATDLSREVDPVRQAANFTNLALTAVSAGRLPKLTTNLLGNTLKGQVVRGALETVPQSLAFGALAPLQDTGRFTTPMDVALGAIGGGIGGAVLGAAAPLAVKGGSKLVQLARDARKGVANDISINKPVQNLPLDSLIAHESTDPARVDFYKKQILNGKPVDPLIAIRDSEGILGIEDGKHRRQAYKELGIKNVPTRVVTRQELKSALQGGFVQVPGGSKPNTFTKRAAKSPEVAEPTQKLIKEANPTYKVRSTQKLAEGSARFSADLESSTKDINSRLAAPEGKIDDKTVSDAIAVAKAHDAAGGHEQSSAIYQSLAKHLTKSGQTVQAASLLSSRTPEGLKFQATRDLKKAGVKVTPELQAKLDAAHQAVMDTQPGTDQRIDAAQAYAKLVADNMPSSASDKLLSFWKAGLLTGVRTQTGNALSNVTFGALHGVSNPLAAGIDKLISLGTGKRTKTLTGKGIISGAGEGVRKGIKVLKTGIDERPALASKYESSGPTFHTQRGDINFGKGPLGKAATTYVNGIFRLMGAADRPAYYAQLRNSLADLAKADGLSQKLSGKQLKAHIDDFIENPPKEAFQTATNEAEKAVLSNETLLSSAATSLRSSKLGQHPVGKVVLGVTAPFTKVPSAFISRVLDFTPVGAVKTAVSQIAHKKFDQRALATALAEATTGTAVIYVGAEMAKNGLISGQYPEDPKEQARWKAEGIQPNSVKLGDTWVSLNYFGPVGSLFVQGKRVVDTVESGGNIGDVAVGGTAGLVQDALGQSFLQGVSGALDAVNDPKRYAANFAKNTAGSVIPTLSNDLAQALDKWQRDASNPGEAILSRIPGLREGLRIKQDAYGNKLEAKTDSANTLTNPLRPSTARTSDVIDEVSRLHDVDPNNRDLQVTPTPIDKAVTISGVKVQLDDQQRYDLQNAIGQKTQGLWSDLIKTPQYKALSDPDKAKALGNLRQDATAIAERDYAAKNNLGPYAPDFTGKDKSLTANQVRLSESPDVARYTQQKTSTAGKNYNEAPDAQYKARLEAYNRDKQDGKLNDVEDVKRQRELVKLKIGSEYDKTVRDLYSLSKTELYDYVSKSKDGKALAAKVMEYDQKLAKAGLIAKPKFKDGVRPKSSKAGISKSRFALSGFTKSSGQRNALRNLVKKASS